VSLDGITPGQILTHGRNVSIQDLTLLPPLEHNGPLLLRAETKIRHLERHRCGSLLLSGRGDRSNDIHSSMILDEPPAIDAVFLWDGSYFDRCRAPPGRKVNLLDDCATLAAARALSANW
jgi:hypothetical protein